MLSMSWYAGISTNKTRKSRAPQKSARTRAGWLAAGCLSFLFLSAGVSHAQEPGITSTPMNAKNNSSNALPAQSPLPLFYKELIPLDRKIHSEIKLSRIPETYAFAAESDVVPIVVTEVAFAAMHYPIVLLDSGKAVTPTLVAVVGNGNRKNQFVTKDGQWVPNVYIPAWVRRYPFFVMRTTADGEPMLGFDPTAERLKSKKAEALIDAKGEPTPLLQEIVAMNMEYQQAGLRTNQLAELLQKAGLLEPVVLKVQSPPKQGENPAEAPAITIGGFLVVNEAKLAQLDKDTLAQLHQSGALSLAYAQLISMQHLRKVFETVSN